MKASLYLRLTRIEIWHIMLHKLYLCVCVVRLVLFEFERRKVCVPSDNSAASTL